MEDINVDDDFECNERFCQVNNAFRVGRTNVTFKKRFKQHSTI